MQPARHIDQFFTTLSSRVHEKNSHKKSIRRSPLFTKSYSQTSREFFRICFLIQRTFYQLLELLIIKKTFKILVCNTKKELLSFLIRRCKLQIVNKSICLTAQGQFKNDQIALPSDIQDNLVMIQQKTLGKQ